MNMINITVFKKISFFSLSIFLALSSLQVFGLNEPLKKELDNINPKQILMVGNSFVYYNNGMHNPLIKMIRSTHTMRDAYKIRSITINGSSLTWHDIRSYVTNPNIGSFGFTKENKLKKIKKTPFDLAIMHDCSRCPVDDSRKKIFHKIVAAHVKTLREKNIEPMLMMTWPYKDSPNMTKKLAREYVKAANKNKILVAPVGLAFAEINENFPEINLYTSDLRHPSKEGTYLAACVLYASIYKMNPEGNKVKFNIDSKTRKTLQKVAWITHQNFYKGR
jgi:hypothetical protein